MVFYFSATGNTKWIAETIAEALGDQTTDILKADPEAYTFGPEDSIGIFFPVYYCIPPDVVTDFAKKLDPNGAYVYAVCNYSNYAGHALQYLSREAIRLDSGYGVTMPDNTSVFGLELDNEESSLKKLRDAKDRVQEIIERLKKKEEGVFDVWEGELDPEEQTQTLGSLYHSGEVTNTNVFSVSDVCIGCGICENNCPAEAIEVQDSKAVWVKDHCMMCAACINNCPVEAIDFLDKSQGVYRYTYDKYAKMI